MPFAQLKDIRIFFRVVFEGREVDTINKDLPTMLVLHGGPGIVDHHIEFDAWSKFSHKIQMVFLDQRGCGRTEDGDLENWTLLQCGKDIKDFCDATSVSNPLIGAISWGGYVAMSYASQFPTHPAALILINSQARIDLSAKKAAYQLAFDKLGVSFDSPPYNELDGDRDAVIERVSEIACEYNRAPTQDNIRIFLKFCVPLFSRGEFDLKAPHRINMEIHKKFIITESLNMDFRSKLRTVNCPVLLIAGDRDPVHPAATGRETASCFPNAKFELVDDAGACVHKDQEKAFLELVNAFLDKILVSRLEHA